MKPLDTELNRYLAAPEAADYMKVSLSWLRKKTASGEIPHAKLGHRVVYDRKDLDHYIQSRKVAEAPSIRDHLL